MRDPPNSILSVLHGRVRDRDHETATMTLSVRQKKHLRRLGVSPALLAELDGALEHHELVKVRVRSGERDARNGMISELCEGTGAELVQRIGHIALLYRPRRKDPAITLPG
jgi:RNA-binding protein YhbY